MAFVPTLGQIAALVLGCLVLLAPPSAAAAAAPEPANLAAQQRFVVAARHAMDAIDFSDVSDPSVLLSLQAQLDADPQVAALRDVWQPLLQQHQLRQGDLERTAAVRRRFGVAFAAAIWDAGAHAMLPVDDAACQDATARLDALASGAPQLRELPVHTGRLGAHRLGELQGLCEQAIAWQQQQRPLLGPGAPPQVVHLVQQLFVELHLGGKVVKVLQLGGWQRDRVRHRVSLRLLLGMLPDGAVTQCQTLEVTLDVPLPRGGRTATAPGLTDLAEPQSISCERLK